MNGKLAGKTALITGASRGIGRGIARAFAAEGASLILAARSAESLAETVESLPKDAQALAIVTDVTVESQVEELFAKGMEKFDQLDILVNNAGVFDAGPIDELTIETWDKVISVNLRAPFLCTRAAFRIMKKQRNGRIINIGSISAQRVRPNSAPYSSSKHGLWGLTQVTALEGREYGISCGCLHPGNTNVETLERIWRERGEPTMKVDDISQIALAMAALPPNVTMLEAVVLPVTQAFIGRG